MSDARTLLRAKRQEARISHPLASYNTSGQLRCIICGTLVKFGSAWEGHLGSKAHRTNVARVREEDRLRDEARTKGEAAAAVRKEEEQRTTVDKEQAGHKRKAIDEDNNEVSGDTATSKKSKLGGGGFPADFFSDASRVPVSGDSSGTDDEGREEPAAPTKQFPSTIDLEYEKFQKELLQAPDFRETYERATVIADPELVPEVPEGFLASGEEGSRAQEGEEEKKLELIEEQKQQREVEEKELIMDRLMEEERAQEEADMKVQMMKNRLEAFKKQREVARAAKAAKQTSW